ncbi:ABC transporter permease [Planotetraspora sp. GP83]|uniref:ABC transporter permease n=1 Tax=Planotetraspora sp. GP83 TaxID=3156264 RepID=UPI003511A9D4
MYLLRRLGFYALAAFVAVSVNFFLPRLAPGDPASTMFANYSTQLTPAALDGLREAYGLTDDPLVVQYGRYLWALLHGDLGVSLSQFPSPVTDVIATGLGWSILLGVVSVAASFVIGCALGAVAAWRRSGIVDRVAPPSLIFVGSFPYFFLALLLMYLLAFDWGVFPLGHAYDDGLEPALTLEFAGSVAAHLALPVFTIVLVSVGSWTLNMRNAMVGVLSEDYLTLAEAKGLAPRHILLRHAVRNALLPNVTMLGMAVGMVFSGQILTEIVFSYPGLGFLLLQAVTTVDYPLMQALFLIITLSVLAANFIVDSLYALLDPRVRQVVAA